MGVCADYRIPHSEFLSWDQLDRDKAIWWRFRANQACSACGTRADEWKADPYFYVAKAVRCRGCELTMQTKKSIKPEDGDGWQVRLDRRGLGLS
jgi:hypothetical protein